MATILILHGWDSSARKWSKVKEILTSQGIEVFTPDLPGFGENPPPKEPWTLDDYVEWVKSFSEGFSSFFLLGHSFGGRVAIKFAFKYPEKLSGVILVSAAGVGKKSIFQKKILKLGAQIFNLIFKFPILNKFNLPLKKFFYYYLLRKSDYLKAKGQMKETFKKIIEEDLTPYLEKIEIPTLIIWGEKDKITPLRDAYLLKEKIKNSKLKILENVSHTPHLEAPQKIAEIILKFIKVT